MVFSSNIFLLYFLPVFFLVYFLMPRKTRNYMLLLASLVFYAWGAPEFIIQFVVSIVANFFIVKRMCRVEKPSSKKLLCALSICISMALLLFYKYGNFMMENLNAVLGWFHSDPKQWTRILLPIGISFFSFQSVTYTLDTYRGVNRPMERLSDYMLYITMFPQLIAGPIIRYCDIADQIRNRESLHSDRLHGFYRFVIGLCKKVLIADVLGLYVDKILGAANLGAEALPGMASSIAVLDSGTAWLVALAYAFEIYFDFAGYSDMAIGLGRVMGFKFPENFDNPYTSRSITEFWRRWHQTLGTFIRNYLYIPLGGNRKGTGRTYLNLWLCFLLSGLWHGASWNFVVWGALHGFFICADKLFLGRVMKKVGVWPSVILTFLTVTILWVFFRIEDIDVAWTFVTRLFAFDFSGFAFDGNAYVYTVMIFAALCSFLTLTGWGKKWESKVFYTEFTNRQHIRAWILAAMMFLFCIAAMNATSFSPFIYFRF